jgi:hypothetical protein
MKTDGTQIHHLVSEWSSPAQVNLDTNKQKAYNPNAAMPPSYQAPPPRFSKIIHDSELIAIPMETGEQSTASSSHREEPTRPAAAHVER